MPVAVGDIVRIVARMKLFSVDDIVNVFHFRVDVNTSGNDTIFMVDVAILLDQLYTLINGGVSPNISYLRIEGINVTQSVLLPDASWPVLAVGGGSGEMLPEMNAASVFHRTLKPRTRASKFLPPTTESSNVEGALSTIYAGLVASYGAFLLAPLTTLNITLAYGAFNRLLATFNQATITVVPNRFRTQRRRRVGVGS